MVRSWRALLAGLACLGLSLGACAPAPVRALNVLCSNEEVVCQAWARGFSAETGTRVAITRLPTTEALARLQAHPGRPEFDIWAGGPAESYIAAQQQGLLAPYLSPEAAAIPSNLRSPDHTWTGVYASVLGFCYSKSRLAALGVGVPATWEDLTNPALAGELVASSPLTSGTAYTLMWTQVQRLGSIPAAWGYLDRLYPNIGSFTRSGTAPARALTTGSGAVAITFAPYCRALIDGPNPDIGLVLPTDGTGYEIGAVAVIAGTDQEASAQAFVDYLASARGQDDSATSGVDQWGTNLHARRSLTTLVATVTAPLLAPNIPAGAAAKPQLLADFVARLEAGALVP